MIFLKVFIFLLAVTSIFILIYKYFDKIKAVCAKVKEKVKAFIYAAKIKIMNVFVSIKNFFGKIFKTVGR